MYFLATTLSPPNLLSLESHNYYLKNIHRSIATSKLLQLSSPLCQVCNGILGQCLLSGPCRISITNGNGDDGRRLSLAASAFARCLTPTVMVAEVANKNSWPVEA
jgi:hypothetical protein